MSTINLVTLTNPRAAASEAFRTLRTNLMFSSVEKPISTFVVSSSATIDNKSTSAANLAVTFAQAGNKTILVDADLRRPTQHEIWNVENERGLSTMMVEDGTLAEPPLLETTVDNLWLLPSGPLPSVPSDLLGSHRMNEIIGVLKARANFVIFDCPPVLAATDAALLGAKTDGVLLIIKAGKTRRDQATRARQVLERIHVRLLGAVLTDARRESNSKY